VNTLIALSVVDIVLLIAGLAFYLFVVGGQLKRIATNLEESAELVRTINRNAEAIDPAVEHINRTGGVVAGALPLLYGMAEGIVAGVQPIPAQRPPREPARPASGRRRSRLFDSVGYRG
jgi:ABC-type transporter Mla subunit MlaD